MNLWKSENRIVIYNLLGYQLPYWAGCILLWHHSITLIAWALSFVIIWFCMPKLRNKIWKRLDLWYVKRRFNRLMDNSDWLNFEASKYCYKMWCPIHKAYHPFYIEGLKNKLLFTCFYLSNVKVVVDDYADVCKAKNEPNYDHVDDELNSILKETKVTV